MMHQYQEREMFAFTEALKLAAAGEEFAHLISLMGPEYATRLRIAVQQLPDAVRVKTIYGAAVGPGYTGKKRASPRS